MLRHLASTQFHRQLQKKIPVTDAILNEVRRIIQAADKEAGVLRISLDTMATVKIGPFSRGSYNRQGEIINSVGKVLGLARSMTYRYLNSTVSKITKSYQKGISLAKGAMQDNKACLERTEGLESWFNNIVPQPLTG